MLRAIVEIVTSASTPAVESPWQSDAPRLAALLLDAQVEMAGQGGAANELMQQLDSALADPVNLPLASVGNLIAARLHESRVPPLSRPPQ